MMNENIFSINHCDKERMVPKDLGDLQVVERRKDLP